MQAKTLKQAIRGIGALQQEDGPPRLTSPSGRFVAGIRPDSVTLSRTRTEPEISSARPGRPIGGPGIALSSLEGGGNRYRRSAPWQPGWPLGPGSGAAVPRGWQQVECMPLAGQVVDHSLAHVVP